MKTRNKALLMALCAVLLVATSIFGTMAYLTATDTVKNTFTVGNVGLNLDEAKATADGTAVGTERTEEGNAYHLLPGHTYVKDPTVTVTAGSDDAYVRMIVEVKNVDKLEAALPAAEYYYNGVQGGMFLLEKLCTGWDATVWKMTSYQEKPVGEGEGAVVTGVYEFRYKEVVAKNEAATKLVPLFTKITVPGAIDNAHLAYLDAVDIDVTAHAIQADGFATADAAWEAFGA